jgi:ATP-dependent Clp protease protease subunit
MPIGVPRIIYSWGEELPAQWTDIYNFIFRRRMVFLMQYLDDELCNQICGLLINIHMEDRSKELEKKESYSGNDSVSGKKSSSKTAGKSTGQTMNSLNSKKEKSIDDLLMSDEDLGIEENNTLEQYTLQKITMEWFKWNSQFFDYSEDLLAELLSKDLTNNDARNLYYGDSKDSLNNGGSLLLKMFKNMSNSNDTNNPIPVNNPAGSLSSKVEPYAPFRSLANFPSQDYNLNDLNPLMNNPKLLDLFKTLNNAKVGQNQNYSKLCLELSDRNFASKMSSNSTAPFGEKALGQRQLRQQYMQDSFAKNNKYYNYLASDAEAANNEFRDYYRKQTEQYVSEEEAKKVFVIINSFGGSVGNGITVHDALQFIKAGSLTLGLGVAASAASLALAGGTIGERYVTEGCHVMIHQPEGGLQGQASDIWIDSQEIMKIRLDVAEIYSLSTYRPKHKILRDLDRDFYLTATETISYGLADEIATNEVMHSIIEMTSKVWDYHDSKQQRLLESRESASSGLDTQTQN